MFKTCVPMTMVTLPEKCGVTRGPGGKGVHHAQYARRPGTALAVPIQRSQMADPPAWNRNRPRRKAGGDHRESRATDGKSPRAKGVSCRGHYAFGRPRLGGN